MSQPPPSTALGIVLLRSPAGSSFDAEVDAVVAGMAAAGAPAAREGTVFRVRQAAGTATVTPEPAPLAYNQAFGPMIAAHPDAAGIVEAYKAHTGLFGVTVEGADPAGAASLLRTILGGIAAHPSASVVILPGEQRFATAAEYRAAEAAAAPAAPAPAEAVGAPVPAATPASEPAAALEPALTAVVLLAEAPRSLGEIVSAISPSMGDPLMDAPVLPRLDITINSHQFVVGGLTSPVEDRQLGGDLAVSPMRSRLTPVVEGHRGAITVGVVLDADWTGAMATFTNVVANVLDRPDAGGVWIPEQAMVTTDVLFQGEAAQHPALTWTRVHAGVLDAQQGMSFAFTRGLAALGGRDVQLVATAEPARLFEDLRQALAEELARGALPRLGGSLTLAGGEFTLTEGTSVAGLGPVLDLRYAPPATR
ncbi:hypothetical protein Bcav_2152 [Beutenbergia cavernae DSM 12333]|uniref:Uncharacterized protein n=1 Tax=Beutenbergia cavernae (strain ATCC BAA-8 / DSM 12333 / CCUG 43141 / JCM 11478 / NBRC 16432 / NCIMB 13614 / HKI 0122) TaxID=471853 RepID=C5C6J8_BEUC1|nr:hypothetical protein [Beutenbergia cavernae]ACQ80404.1 hypothetical protein Bcav_2152 [Beutenbergia cavernae DSM 12333]